MKKKYKDEQKIEIVKRYLRGEQGKELAEELGMPRSGQRQIEKWVERYRESGENAFREARKSKEFSEAEKEEIVEEYLRGGKSLSQICAREKISSTSTLSRWIKVYNSRREKPQMEEKEMAREFTTAERLAIVKECKENGKRYGATAEKYGIGYRRVYDWVKKYEKEGEKGLEDHRGRKRKDEEKTEVERQAEEIRRLRKELHYKELELEMVKKLIELERG